MMRKTRQSASDRSWDERKYIALEMFLIVLAIIMIFAHLSVRHKAELQHKAAPAQQAEFVVPYIQKVMRDFYIEQNLLRPRDDLILARIPEKFRFPDFYFALSDELQQVDAQIVRCVENTEKHRIEIELELDDGHQLKFWLERTKAIEHIAGVVAIIIDDFGYGYNDLVNSFIFFPRLITLSIIPGLKESNRIATEARLANKEVLVHMPMEPLDEKYEDHGLTLISGQDPGMVRLRMKQAISLVPGAVGMNNHQGSRVTADDVMMQIVMDELKRHDFFFIDSRTNPQTVAFKVAREMNVRTALNQVFIDVIDDEAFIASQIRKLADIANEKGKAIGIGHVRKKTYKVLEEMMPELETHGIKFVCVSNVL